MSRFPTIRPRRLRTTDTVRALVRESRLTEHDFIAPVFVVEGTGVRREIPSMPGVYHHSLDRLAEAVDPLLAVGVRSVILFGIPNEKDSRGSDTLSESGIIQRAVQSLKADYPDVQVITDVCLCEYTDHGHCGLVQDGEILNDETLPLLARQAVSHAEAGANIVAPSGMMDGAVGVIRNALDEAGHTSVAIMAYSVKYASSFYGPFRDAVQSAPEFGDRSTHQMDPANRREALREAALDAGEGADVLMVKPALAFLDIISDLRSTYNLPIAAYNVSGEYSMIMAGDRAGWIDGDAVMMESLLSMKRAGADVIITYFAEHAASIIRNTTG